MLEVAGRKNGIVHNCYGTDTPLNQTYLRIVDVDFTVVSSNNHASPSGALPFLLPTASSDSQSPSPVPSNKLKRWLATRKPVNAEQEPSDIRNDAYMSLLENGIRKAWVSYSRPVRGS